MTRTFPNSDDAENICVKLYVSMRAGVRNIAYAGGMLRQRIVNMREMENRSPELLCVKSGSQFKVQDIPD